MDEREAFEVWLDSIGGANWSFAMKEIAMAGWQARAALAATQAPIYQTCFIQGKWRDVDKFEYDRAKSLSADLARIVYAAPVLETATQAGHFEPVGELVGHQQIGFGQFPVVAWERHVPIGTKIYAAPDSIVSSKEE